MSKLDVRRSVVCGTRAPRAAPTATRTAARYITLRFIRAELNMGATLEIAGWQDWRMPEFLAGALTIPLEKTSIRSIHDDPNAVRCRGCGRACRRLRQQSDRGANRR